MYYEDAIVYYVKRITKEEDTVELKLVGPLEGEFSDAKDTAEEIVQRLNGKYNATFKKDELLFLKEKL